jgi:hypothetical protein
VLTKYGSRFSAWLLAANLLTVQSLDAASFTLTPEQRNLAMEMGRQSVISDRFGAEWRVSGDATGEGLVVMTPFHRLALAARNSAFKSQDLKPNDVDALLKEEEGKLTVWATLKGPKVDFARFYSPTLVSGQQQIKPSFTQNERTARREDDGGYTARCLYVFPVGGLKPSEPLTLIVRDTDGKPVAKFTMDLSAMR